MNRIPPAKWLVFFWSVAVWGVISAWPALTADPLVLTAKDSGRTLNLSVGERLVVNLNLGPGQHLISPAFNPEVLTLIGQSLQSMTTPKGASTRVVYEFAVQQAGQTDLVVAVKGAQSATGQEKPFFKVKIIAAGGGARI